MLWEIHIAAMECDCEQTSTGFAISLSYVKHAICVSHYPSLNLVLNPSFACADHCFFRWWSVRLHRRHIMQTALLFKSTWWTFSPRALLSLLSPPRWLRFLGIAREHNVAHTCVSGVVAVIGRRAALLTRVVLLRLDYPPHTSLILVDSHTQIWRSLHFPASQLFYLFFAKNFCTTRLKGSRFKFGLIYIFFICKILTYCP